MPIHYMTNADSFTSTIVYAISKAVIMFFGPSKVIDSCQIFNGQIPKRLALEPSHSKIIT